MKRTISAFVLVICVFFGAQVYGQASAPIDLVLLLDTSAGMSSSYDNVNNYITGAFLNEYLRVGDTFHLISFSSNPRLDAARRISGIGDVETIVARMLLQYPVERGSNVGAAISYAEQYILSLPGRPKKIVLVSTGGSDTAGLVSGARTRLSSRNTTFDYIQVTPGQPLTNLPTSGRPPAAGKEIKPTVKDTGNVGTVTDGKPKGGIGTTGTGSTNPPDTTGDGKKETVVSEKKDQGTGTRNDDKKETVVSGKDEPSGDNNIGTGIDGGKKETVVSGRDEPSGTKTDDKPGASEKTYSETVKTKEAGMDWTSNLPLIIGVILGILLLLGLILLLSSRRLGSSPNRVMAQAARPSPYPETKSEERFKDHSKDLNSYAASSARRSTPYDDRNLKSVPVINPSGPLLLNLHVEDQNTAIGKRNIHSLKSGYGFSVGGGKSDDFLIFLVPIPSGVGEIRRDGSSLTFTPKKAKYFPDIGSNPVRDCINKTIRIVSDKNYEMRFRFEMYEDPLIALNRVLMQVKVPGM